MLHTRGSSGDRATLVLATPVPLDFGAAIHNVVLRGRGSIEGLDREVSRTLEGFRVRASLEGIAGVAQAVGAGVLQPEEGEAFFGQAPVPGHGLVWISTTWVSGCTLRQAWPELSADERQAALEGVATALASLHQHGVLHGDIKPENVIVTPERRVVLIDLETLREVGEADAPIPCKEFTPGYGAPEQEGQHQSYLASDLWALGVLAASLLLEREPSESIRQLRQGAQLPAPWTEIARACLEPSPAARPGAASVIATLRGGSRIAGRAAGATTIRVRDPAPRRRDPAQTLPDRSAPAGAANDTLVPVAMPELQQMLLQQRQEREASAGKGAPGSERTGTTHAQRDRAGQAPDPQPPLGSARRSGERPSAIGAGVRLLPLVMGGLSGAVLAGFVTIVAMVDSVAGFAPSQEMVLFVWGPTAGFSVGALAAFALGGSPARIFSFLALVVLPALVGAFLNYALVFDAAFHSQEVRVLFESTLFVLPGLGLGWWVLERIAHYGLRAIRWLSARRAPPASA